MRNLLKQKQIKICVLLFLIAFFAGIAASCILLPLQKSEIFHEESLRRISNIDAASMDVLWFIGKKRFKALFLIGLLTMAGLGPIVFYGIFCIWGFACGMMLTALCGSLGLIGVLVFILMGFPQILFYLAGWFLYFFFQKSLEEQRMERGKYFYGKGKRGTYAFLLAAMFIVVIMGILIESYVNPYILKNFLNILYT